ncbi:MAG: leucine--tRNA ligase, partial [Bdellovibrionaceae bacterium]|nr:leucine--tRNA ligase [Pseudobdellovibrionaceae bacterium]
NYAFHPLTGERLPIFIGNYVLVDYGTGAVMSVPAHDERDYAFWKFARQSLNIELPWRPVVRSVSSQDLSVECFPDDGIVVNSRQFSEMSSAVARERIIEELERIGLGEKKIFYKMRDWIFSRQRYWGEPFPLMFDDKGQIVPVPESELPVKLPDMEDFQPSSDGSAPLARVKDWVVVTDKQGRTYYRVTDTMPGWAGSCWYYLRFMDSHCKTAPFSQEAVNYWKQVDLYVGGASHAVMHLLYARFWHKVLYDLGLVPTKEPFKKLFNQGMVTAFAFRDRTGRLVPSDEVENMNGRYVKKGSGEEVERLIAKMAKSLRNVVNPDEVIERHGCDTLRLYQMFMGPLADDKPWDDEGVVGCENFLRRWWTFLVDEDGSIKCQKEENPLNWKALHKALKRVNESFQNFNFNVAVAAFMEALNDIKKNQQTLSQPQVEFLVKMMHPFAPHLTSEIWERLGHKGWLHLESWPELDENWLKEDQFELVMQINGKTKKKEMVDRSLSQLEIENLVKDRLKNHLSAKEILKIVYVPFKLCNVVVRDK